MPGYAGNGLSSAQHTLYAWTLYAWSRTRVLRRSGPNSGTLGLTFPLRRAGECALETFFFTDKKFFFSVSVANFFFQGGTFAGCRPKGCKGFSLRAAGAEEFFFACFGKILVPTTHLTEAFFLYKTFFFVCTKKKVSPGVWAASAMGECRSCPLVWRVMMFPRPIYVASASLVPLGLPRGMARLPPRDGAIHPTAEPWWRSSLSRPEHRHPPTPLGLPH